MRNKFILMLAVLSLIFLVIIISSHSVYHYNRSIKDKKEKAWALAKTISKAIELPMLEGEMQTVQDILGTVGQLEDLKRVHITDDKGVVRYSAQPERINTPTGSAIIMQAIKKKAEVDDFEHREDDYIFSLALPINNEERCYPCHGSEKDLLGVLRVGMDWIPIRNTLMRVLQRDVLVAMIFYLGILILSFLFQRLYNNAEQAHTHLQQAQEQLIKTEKMAAIGQMAAAISHDLRNPLTGIKMAAYYLGSKIDRTDLEIDNILKDIELEIEYASNVVTNILTYSRPAQLIYKRADINKIIEDTMHFVFLQNRDSHIELIKNYDKNIPEMLMDNKQIKQVIINLLANSMQAMPDGGKLTIQTGLKPEEVEIKITDTGAGIELKNLERIFTRFFTTKARGVGLGLSIVSNIVQKHGGFIEVNSGLDKGACFTVHLPIHISSDDRRQVDYEKD
ncbi:MAG: ATP-binding protein [Candidatus Omnitrophica bacterium]|nr:ATP-binding protein [Candidatus Omnitrophota bacterium]